MRLLEAKNMMDVVPRGDAWTWLEIVWLVALVVVAVECVTTGHIPRLLVESTIRFRAAVEAAWIGFAKGTHAAVKAYAGCERKVRKEHGVYKPTTNTNRGDRRKRVRVTSPGEPSQA